MKFINNTHYQVETILQEAVLGFPVEGLIVEIIYTPTNSRRYASGTYYRQSSKYKEGKYIRLRINKSNTYPLETSFKTSEYEKKTDRKGNAVVYQRLLKVRINNPEQLAVALFLHEFSHYMDHIAGLNGKFKQTKADKFAVEGLERMGMLQLW